MHRKSPHSLTVGKNDKQRWLQKAHRVYMDERVLYRRRRALVQALLWFEICVPGRNTFGNEALGVHSIDQ
jgi:hypothetical protein